MKEIKTTTNKSHSAFFEPLIFFVCAFIVITVCSKCSVLYPLNDWDDANCFFTVGKAMMNGKVLYRDIFEQKGPVLYMLHGIAWEISHTTFIGIYFLEIICCFVFLYFSYRTMKLFSDKRIIIAVVPLSAFVYTSLAFCSGDSAEELCLPMLAYVFYTAMERIKSGGKLKLTQMLFCGICTGIMLWIKFTVLGFIIGFAAAFVILYIRQKEYLHILKCSIAMIAGIIIASIPVIAYFIRTDSFSYLWDVYFYDNMFLYSGGIELPPVIKQAANLLWGLLSFAMYNTFGLLMLAAAFYRVIKKESKTLIFVFSAIVISGFFFSFIGGRAYAYYSLSMSVFAPVGAVQIYDVVKNKLNISNSKKRYFAAVCVLSLLVTVFMCRNTYTLFTDKDDMPQFRFNNIISQKNNAKLLNYGFLDGGFYTVSGTIPECRFFCGLNIELPELKETQDEYINSGRADFIVTKDKKLRSENYRLADSCKFRYWSENSIYYLYERIN